MTATTLDKHVAFAMASYLRTCAVGGILQNQIDLIMEHVKAAGSLNYFSMELSNVATAKPKWVFPTTDGQMPAAAGYYRVMMPGDSETDGPHVHYDYPDWEDWAYFEPRPVAEPSLSEMIKPGFDFMSVPALDGWEDGEEGQWVPENGEAEDIMAWCGPFVVPPCKFPKSVKGSE